MESVSPVANWITPEFVKRNRLMLHDLEPVGGSSHRPFIMLGCPGDPLTA